MSMELYNGNKTVAQFCGCHDLHTTDREFLFKRTATADVVYSTKGLFRLDALTA